MTVNLSFKSADRIASIKPYFFADLVKRIAILKAQGMDVISLDMGSPDLPPADFIIDTLVQQARRNDTHRYTPYGGTTTYRKAIAAYYAKRFGVELDPTQEVLGLVGSKEGLFHLSQVMLNPGDISLIPDPGYPTYASGAWIAGAETYNLPLIEENDYLPNLDAIPTEILKRAKLLWLNYPNNPTGAVAPTSFFEKAVEFAHANHILLAHDAPYTDVCFGDYHAPSLLEVDGAKEVAVEFNSLSKAYNMGGWRLGMVVGNPQVIGYMHAYKTQVDTSHFQPMLDAGITALTGNQNWIVERNKVYQERRDVVVEGLRKAGFEAAVPAATIYVWAKLPKQYPPDSVQFSNKLLQETGVSTTPGAVYGAHGEGYIRVSLGIPADRIREAMNRILDWTSIKT